MRLEAAGHLASRSLDARLRRMAALEAMEAKSPRRQKSDSLFDVSAYKDVTKPCHVYAAAYTANIGRLLLLRR